MCIDSNILSYPQNLLLHHTFHLIESESYLPNHLSPKLGFIPDEVSKKQKWFCPSLFFNENPSAASRYLACLHDLTPFTFYYPVSLCGYPIHSHIYTKWFYTSTHALPTGLPKFPQELPSDQAFPTAPSSIDHFLLLCPHISARNKRTFLALIYMSVSSHIILPIDKSLMEI